MRLLLLLLLPALGFAQTGFRAEFNYLVPDTPVEGGDYRLRGLYADGDALGFPVDSVTAGKFFYDAKGRLYEIVYSNAAQPLTIEVDTVGHSFAPTLGTGLLTDRTVNILLPFETSKIAGKLRSVVEVEMRKLVDFNSAVEVDKLADLLDVDTTGQADNYALRYDAGSGNYEMKENNIDGLSDATFDQGNQGNLFLANAKTIPSIPGPENNGNIGIGYATFDSLKYGQENAGIGIAVAVNADSLFRSIGVGKSSMGGYTHTQGIYHTKATESVYFGLFSGGMDSLSYRSTQVGTYTNGGTGAEKRININGVLLGYAAKSLQNSSVYETAIGANVTGNGDSTATIGQTFLKGTYLNGTMNFNGYGLGNKEAADLSKTGSGYFLEVATDGTLIESTVTGGTAQTLSFDDATRELSISSGNTVDLSEGIQEEVATLLQAGSNVTLTYDDGAGTLTIAATGGGGATNLGDLGDVTITSATTGQVLKYNGAEWINAAESGGIALTDLSVTTNAAGSAALSYNNTNGVFSFTPPDLSSYLTSEVDGSVTNEIQDLSLTGNTLSLSEDATTVDLSGYLDDQTVSLTGAGITTISGTYPNFTITSTEVDGSTTNELQTLSFNDATRQLTLSDDGTIDLSEGIQDEIAATLVQGEGISLTYDDGAGTLTIAAPSGAGNTDEQTLSINSATAELSISNGNTVDLSEAIDAQVNTLFVDGTNIQSTYDDGTNTLTVRTTDALTQIDAITFDNNTTDAATGRLQYDQDKGTLVFGLQNNTPIYLGTDMGFYVKNQSGTSIAKGVPVYTSGTDGASGRKLISPMIADGSINAKYFLGITAEAIANGGDGLVLSNGGIKGINLSGFSANDVLYVSPTVAGTFVNTEPSAPNLKLPVGYVVNNVSNGVLSIRTTVGTYLSETHDVQIASASNGEVLKFDGSKWVDGTDLVDDADADPTNEIQTMTATNGLSVSATGNDYEYRWGGNLSQATTVDGLDSYNILFDNLTSFTTNVVNDVRLNAESVAYGNNSSLIFDDFTGASITNTGTTNQYTSSLNMLRSGELSLKQDRTYASEELSQGLIIAAADATLKLFSNSVTNSTSTSINLSPDEVKFITPNVFATTATTGQFLQLTDGATGTVEFATALTSEVDGSVTNEIQDLSLSGNTLSLSGDATTVDLSGYLDEATTASNGLTETGNDIKLGGTLSGTTLIDIESNNFYINDDGATQTGIAIIPGSEEVNIVGKITGNTELQMTAYGLGNKEASDLSLTGSAYLASFATDGTLIEYPISSISGESTTASNGLTLSGSDVKLGGTLSEITNISMAGFNASIYDVSSNTGFAIQPSSNLIVNYGTQAFDDYGSGNKEAADLSKTKSNYKAAFATDGTLIEYDDIDAMVVACSDETTDITTGTAKVTFRAPHAMTITGVRASLTTASSSGTVTIDINEDISGGGASILGTKLTIDANEKTSTTAATAATITDTAIADDAEITIDIDAAGTGATGLKVTILYRKN